MTAKIEPWMIDAMKSLHCEEYYTDAMAECDARHIAAHVPKQPEWEAKEKALRVFILRNADHGVDDTGEYCRAGEFTRTVFEDGTAEVYPCTCGLDELRTILNREQEKL